MKTVNITSIFILIVLMQQTIFSQEIHITPTPYSVVMGKNTFTLSNKTAIFSAKNAPETAHFLQQKIKENFNLDLKVDQSSTSKRIIFKMDAGFPDEGYEIKITKNKVALIAATTTGWFYASQTLLQIISQKYKPNQKKITIPEVSIQDYPRFSWRAFMLDESRHFKGTAQVKLLLDEMAYLKMNVFHWHLVDDQGWRIEIKKYPKLTTIGSKRKSTQVGPKQWKSPIQSGEPHEGFYTQEEIKEIIKYANERHITIVPEIEMPGHSSAAIAAYPWLGTSKKKIEVPIKFGVGKDVYDVTDPKVYQFLTDVLDEVMALFPSDVIHIGGDEVKYNHWKNSKSVNAFMQKKGLQSPADLQVYFTNNISNYLQKKGRRMMGWNEILGHNLHYYQDKNDTKTSQTLAKNAIVHFWKGDVSLATNAAKSGYDIVNSLHSSTYLDYTYKAIPLKKAYDFNPIPKGLEKKYHTKVIGLGTQMWGEWIPTNGQMHYQVFPRIAAYAEVGWTFLKNKNYNKFLLNLPHLKKHWKNKEIYFADEPPTSTR